MLPSATPSSPLFPDHLTPALTRKGSGCRYKRLRWVGMGLGTFWLVLALWQAPVVKMTSSAQIHGVWMTHVSAALMYYSLRLDEVVATLAQHRLNTLYPCVWNRGHTLYPSQVVKAAGGLRQDPLINVPLFPWDDPLQGLTTQAHRQHLRILPWFEYGLMIPVSAPLAKAHPDWLTTNAAGSFVPHPLTPWARLPKPLQHWQLALVGGNLAWLNPFHPEVQTFLADLISEVVARYPVDGIQLDDHFGLPIEMGYDAYTRQLYQADHGGASPPSDPGNPEWVAWRAQRITQLMAKISQAVKTVNPQALISVSPNPPVFAYQKYLQDWVSWVEQGFVDEVIVQVYRQNLATLKQDLYHSGFYELQGQIPIAIGLYTGPIFQAKPIVQIAEQIKAVQAAGYQGVAFFSWESTLWIFKQGSAQQVRSHLVESLT